MGLMRPLLTPLIAQVAPTLDLDLTAEYLDPRIIFTRNSTRYIDDSAGTHRQVNNNEWPREYDPETVTRINLLFRSQEFDNASWAKNGTTIAGNDAIAPDGSGTADKLIETATTGIHGVQQNFSVPLAAITFAFSIYAKASERTHLAFGVSGGSGGLWAGGTPQAVFDVAAGVVVSQTAGVTSASITDVGYGWRRLEVRANSSGTLAGAAGFSPLLVVGGAGNYSGDGVSGMFLWGAQLERASSAGPYMPTDGFLAGNGVCIGRRVWESRTNLIRQSAALGSSPWVAPSASVTTNNVVGPDLGNSGDTITITTGGGRLYQQAGATITAGSRLAASIFALPGTSDWLRLDIAGSDNSANSGDRATAWFNVRTGEVGSTNIVGTGWSLIRVRVQRRPFGWCRVILCIVSATTTQPFLVLRPVQFDGDTTGIVGGSVVLWGAQLEVGGSASAHINTSGATGTRAADTAEITNMSWYRPQEGITWIAEGGPDMEDGNSAGATFAGFGLSSDNNTFRTLGYIDTRLNVGVTTPAANVPGLYDLSGQTVKLALAHSRFGAGIGAVNGTAYSLTAPAGSGTIDFALFDRFGIGNAGRATTKTANILNGSIKRLRVWNAQLTQAEVNALTAQ